MSAAGGGRMREEGGRRKEEGARRKRRRPLIEEWPEKDGDVL
jgi:hypothetical protein